MQNYYKEKQKSHRDAQNYLEETLNDYSGVCKDQKKMQNYIKETTKRPQTRRKQPQRCKMTTKWLKIATKETKHDQQRMQTMTEMTT